MGGQRGGSHRYRRSGRRRLVLASVGVVLVLLATGGGVAWWRHGSRAEPKRAGGNAASPAPTPSRTSESPSPTPSKKCDADCRQQKRYAAAQAYMDKHAATNAYLSVQITDRKTGKTWQHGPVTHPGWTASTIKLAMATDILRRQRAGQVTLTDADRTDMANMLNFSDENASDRLWQRYGGDDQLARFRDVFGMSGLHFVPGFTNGTYWGFVKCTTEDLSHLMIYVLTQTAPDDRAYLVSAMRGVAPNQRWGVWAAGQDQHPGDKDGWSFETDSYGKHWVLNSVGFAGPDERYAIAIMFQVQPHSTIAYGTHTVSDVVGLLFGVPAPAKITVPEPDG